MLTQGPHVRVFAAVCLVALLAGLSAQSASASLFGDYTTESSAAILVDNQLADTDASGLSRLPVIPTSLVAAYAFGYIVGRAVAVVFGVTQGPSVLAEVPDPLDFSRFDPVS